LKQSDLEESLDPTGRAGKDGVYDDCYWQHQLIGVTFDCPASTPDHTDQEWRQLKMLSSIPYQKEIRDGANVGGFPASPDHTEKRWRQCWQFRSITYSYRTKMTPMLAVSQNYLILPIKAFLRHC
jgi:hypothetical protein